MVGVYKFKEYKDEAFLNFVHELSNLYKMTKTQFYPHQGKNIFNDFQLSHIAPNWDMKNPRGFMYMWLQHRDIVRVITLEIFSPDKSLRIKMTIDLEKKFFTVEEVIGVSFDEIIIVLNRHFSIKNLVSLNEASEVLIISLIIFFFISFLLTFDAESFRGGLGAKIFLWVIISLFAIIGLYNFFETHYFGWGTVNNLIKNKEENIANKLTENKEESIKRENSSKSSMVWWRDTFTGVIIIAIIPGLIIAFLVYLFGWNK